MEDGFQSVYRKLSMSMMKSNKVNVLSSTVHKDKSLL